MAHAEAIRLLAEDVADIPEYLLDTAAKRWVRENRFMPRASELVELARGTIIDMNRGSDHTVQKLQDNCDGLNRKNFVIASGKPYFVNVRETETGPLHFVDRRA